LEASFVVFRLQPYFENFGKRIIKSPKLYFTDVGLATYCLDIHKEEQLARDPLRGSLTENFVISEFIKHRINAGLEPNCYFYRDSNQHEVDLLIKEGNQLVPIEIKSSKTFHPEFLKGLHYFKEIAPDRFTTGFLIYAGDREQRIQSMLVKHFSHVRDLQINNIPIWHPILPSSCPDQIYEKTRWTMGTPALFRRSDRGKLTTIWAPNGYIIYLEIPYFNLQTEKILVISSAISCLLFSAFPVRAHLA